MKTYIQDKNVLVLKSEDGSGIIIPTSEPKHPHYVKVLEEIEKGEAQIVPYVPPAPTWEEIRAQRNILLTESDWAIMEDVNPKPSKQAWLTYRQTLRDITTTYASPEAVIWPTKPA